MSANTTPTPASKPIYHAEAFALDGDLARPFEQVIHPLANVKLPRSGGYLSARVQDYRLQGVVSFRSAYTQVAGTMSLKSKDNMTTLATSVIEDFNVLDILTADRIVSQIHTDHPPSSYVPHVSFLGTRFENLRIAGHPVKLELNTDFLGARPPGDAFYGSDQSLRDRINAQRQSIEGEKNVALDISESYNQTPSKTGSPGWFGCSLVNYSKGFPADGSLPNPKEPEPFPGRCIGHVIDVPHFGKIYLAVLRVDESAQNTTISLTMIKIRMGCSGSGPLNGGSTLVNGNTKGSG